LIEVLLKDMVGDGINFLERNKLWVLSAIGSKGRADKERRTAPIAPMPTMR
jgi:hypothetical protein